MTFRTSQTAPDGSNSFFMTKTNVLQKEIEIILFFLFFSGPNPMPSEMSKMVREVCKNVDICTYLWDLPPSSPGEKFEPRVTPPGHYGSKTLTKHSFSEQNQPGHFGGSRTRERARELEKSDSFPKIHEFGGFWWIWGDFEIVGEVLYIDPVRGFCLDFRKIWHL